MFPRHGAARREIRNFFNFARGGNFQKLNAKANWSGKGDEFVSILFSADLSSLHHALFQFNHAEAKAIET
jgi:hypothetical protein